MCLSISDTIASDEYLPFTETPVKSDVPLSARVDHALQDVLGFSFTCSDTDSDFAESDGIRLGYDSDGNWDSTVPLSSSEYEAIVSISNFIFGKPLSMAEIMAHPQMCSEILEFSTVQSILTYSIPIPLKCKQFNASPTPVEVSILTIAVAAPSIPDPLVENGWDWTRIPHPL